MRRILKFASALLLGGLLLLSIAATALVLAGDDFYRWSLGQIVQQFSDREIRANGSFSFDLSWEPTISVTELSVANSAWSNEEYLALIERLEVQFDLRGLLSGVVRMPHLTIKGLDVNLETSEDDQENWHIGKADTQSDDLDGDSDSDSVLRILPPEHIVFQSFNLQHVDHRIGRRNELILEYLNSKFQTDKRNLIVDGKGNVNGQTFNIAGEVGTLEDALQGNSPLPIALSFQLPGLAIDLAGNIREPLQGTGIDLSLKAKSDSVQDLLQNIQIDFPVPAKATLTAKITGRTDALTVEKFDFDIVHQLQSNLQAEGQIEDINNGKGVELRFTSDIDKETLRALSDHWSILQPYTDGTENLVITGSVKGDYDAFSFQTSELSLRHENGAAVGLDGQIGFDNSADDLRVTQLALNAALTMPDRHLLEKYFAFQMPELGAIEAKTSFALENVSLIMQSFSATAEKFGGTVLQGSGKLADLSPTEISLTFSPQLDLSVSSSDSATWIDLIDMLTANDAGAKPTPAKVTPGTLSKSQMIAEIQRRLMSADFDPGPIDGLMGKKTRQAIIRFQKQNNLTADGSATMKLLQTLRKLQRDPERAGPTKDDRTAPNARQILAAFRGLGPVNARGRLSILDEVYRLEKLKLKIGGGRDGTLVASGRLNLTLPSDQPPLLNIDLSTSLDFPNLKLFDSMLPASFPALSDIKIRSVVRGNSQQIVIADANMSAAGEAGLQFVARGGKMRIRPRDEKVFQSLAINLQANWPSLEGISKIIGHELPKIGEVAITADVNDTPAGIELKNVNARIGVPTEPLVEIKGGVKDLAAGRGLELNGQFDVPALALLEFKAISTQADLGNIRGKFSLSDLDGSFGLETINAEIHDSNFFTLKVNGQFDDFGQRDEINLETELDIPNVKRLANALGLETNIPGNLKFEGRVSGDDESFNADGFGTLGKTELVGQMSGRLVDDRPILKAKITSPLVHLADLGFQPVTVKPKKVAPATSTNVAAEPVFSREPMDFEALKTLDLSLDVLFEDVIGVSTSVDTITGHVELKNGKLTLAPFNMNFVGGRMNAELSIDAQAAPPAYDLSISADDINLGNFLAQTQVDVPLEGDLHLVADLAATGNTAHEIAASLEGNIDLAVENGYVKSGLLRLSTTNPVTWMFTKSARRGYSQLNCLIMRFDTKAGRANSSVLIIDTPNSLVTGTGFIELGEEQLALEFSPTAKRRRLIPLSTPFTITGPLANPNINVGAMGMGARVTSEVVLSPVNLFGSLFQMFSSESEADSPCLKVRVRE